MMCGRYSIVMIVMGALLLLLPQGFALEHASNSSDQRLVISSGTRPSMLEFSPDTKLLACSGFDGSVYLLRTNTTDGTIVVSYADSGAAERLDALEGRPLVEVFQWMDNSQLLVGYADGRLLAWDVEERIFTEVLRLPGHSPYAGVAVLEDTKFMVARGHILSVHSSGGTFIDAEDDKFTFLVARRTSPQLNPLNSSGAVYTVAGLDSGRIQLRPDGSDDVLFFNCTGFRNDSASATSAALSPPVYNGSEGRYYQRVLHANGGRIGVFKIEMRAGVGLHVQQLQAVPSGTVQTVVYHRTLDLFAHNDGRKVIIRDGATMNVLATFAHNIIWDCTVQAIAFDPVHDTFVSACGYEIMMWRLPHHISYPGCADAHCAICKPGYASPQIGCRACAPNHIAYPACIMQCNIDMCDYGAVAVTSDPSNHGCECKYSEPGRPTDSPQVAPLYIITALVAVLLVVLLVWLVGTSLRSPMKSSEVTLLSDSDPTTAVGGEGVAMALLAMRALQDSPVDELVSESESDADVEYSPRLVIETKEIGRGGYGRVAEGVHRVTNEQVAIKTFDVSADADCELRMLLKLRHPRIVSLKGFHIDASVQEALLYLEFVPGGSAYDAMTSRGRMFESVVRRFISDALVGLEYLHAEGVIHGDIKPHNLLVDVIGRVKVADFGCSREVVGVEEGTPTESSGAVGTPQYMAPEIMKGMVCFASDVWSLGATAVHLLSGLMPWHETGLAGMPLMAHVVKGDASHPKLPSHMSSAAYKFVMQCFERNPLKRLTCTELLKYDFVNMDLELPDAERIEQYRIFLTESGNLLELQAFDKEATNRFRTVGVHSHARGNAAETTGLTRTLGTRRVSSDSAVVRDGQHRC